MDTATFHAKRFSTIQNISNNISTSCNLDDQVTMAYTTHTHTTDRVQQSTDGGGAPSRRTRS